MPSTVWRGQLTFGLVSVPVRLHRAARKERIKLQYVGRSAPAEEDDNLAPAPLGGTKGRANEPIPIQSPSRTPVPDNDDPEDVLPVTPLKQTYTVPDGQAIPRTEVLRGYEVAPNQYVTVKQEELRQLRLPTSPTMEILRTTRLPEIDPPQRTQYLRAARRCSTGYARASLSGRGARA